MFTIIHVFGDLSNILMEVDNNECPEFELDY